MELSLLAPAIVGTMVGVAGGALMLWIAKHRPQLAPLEPVSEESSPPFESNVPVRMTRYRAAQRAAGRANREPAKTN